MNLKVQTFYIKVIVVLFGLTGLNSPLFAVAGSTIVMNESIKTVPAWTQVGPPSPFQPLVTRDTLTASEEAEITGFEVALKMRHYSELQERLAKGELIPPQEMLAKYDPLPADEKAVVQWLKSQGFTITRQDTNHLAVFAKGTVTQVEKAMQVRFGRVSYNWQNFTSAVTAPSLLANLSAAVLGINGLQPHLQAHKHVILKTASLTGTNAPYLPSQIAKANNATSLYSAGYTGAGQSIAIVIDTFPSTSDLTSFWQTYGVSQSLNNIKFIQVIAGPLPSTSEEETLDTEWSSSIAPGAKVRVYATLSLSTTRLDTAYQQVYNDATNHPEYGLHQMSMSYGIGETYTSQSQVNTDAQYFSNLASAGVTVFASSGDGASTPGDSGSNPDTTGPLQVESPASDVNVTGVGGTSLFLDSNGNENSESAWIDSGGGTSIYFNRPSWQTGTGVPGVSKRSVPDVACPADPNNGAVLIYNGSQTAVGGTSWSSPTWAGYCALINQARASTGQSALGVLGPKVYPLIGTSNFRDTTSGDNNANPTNSGGNYSAGTGYDRVTGIGVPLMQTLTQTLTGVLISPLSQSVPPGNSVTFTVTTNGSPISYQWQRMPIGSSTWSNLNNTAPYSGVNTTTLTVYPTSSAMNGDQFQCVVQFASSSLASSTGVLTVETPLVVKTLAGTVGTMGDGTTSNFYYPSGIAFDTAGNLYIADFSNNAIRKVTTSGVVTTPYGSLTAVSGNTNGMGNNALFNQPNSVASDGSNLYVADYGNNVIRKIVLSTSQVTTLTTGFNGPNSVAIDGSGNLYVADTNNNVIKKVTQAGAVSTLAGSSGTSGFANGTGTQALFNTPVSVAVDSNGNVYVADSNNFVVRKITPGGVVSTFAGKSGYPGYVDGPALTKALFNTPFGLTIDSTGNVYVCDSQAPATGSTAAGNDLLRKISPSGAVSTLAGAVGVAGSTDGTGTSAQFYSLQAAAIANSGAFYLADTYNQTIRVAGLAPKISTAPLGQVITVGKPVTFTVTPSGTGPFTYQWLKNGSMITGATNSFYTIPKVSGTDAANYAVTVSSTFGSVTSSTATLIPVNSQPVAQGATIGTQVTFSISVAGPGPFAYQWLFNGASISGATNSSYTIQNPTSANAGNYSVVVSNAYGIVTTNPVNLSVSPALTDTPTLPTWALLVLGSMLVWLAGGTQAKRHIS